MPRIKKFVNFFLSKRFQLCLTNLADNCCVFRPANGCSARRLLVEIDFLMLKQLFQSLMEQNKQKNNAKNNAKSCFRVKKFISTSVRRAEHLFAGRNTQQTMCDLFKIPNQFSAWDSNVTRIQMACFCEFTVLIDYL